MVVFFEPFVRALDVDGNKNLKPSALSAPAHRSRERTIRRAICRLRDKSLSTRNAKIKSLSTRTKTDVCTMLFNRPSNGRGLGNV